MVVTLVVALALVVLVRPPVVAGAEETPDALLAHLVDLPTPAARAEQATKLAKMKGISLDAWLEAARRFGRFRRQPTGPRQDDERIVIGGRSLLTPVAVYVPESYKPDKPARLMMTFHGSGGGGAEMYVAWRAVADALGMIIVSPTDRRAIGGFTMTPLERETGWAAVRWARRTFNIDERRMYATGISRGGHLLWDMALRQPDRFAALAPMIGGPLVSLAQGRNNVRYAENLVGVPIRDLQGMKDDPGLIANLQLIFKRLAVHGAKEAKLIPFPELGHGFRMEAVDWAAFLGPCKREPVPARVIRRSARKGSGRAAWVEILETKTPTKEQFRLNIDAKRWGKLTKEKQRELVTLEAERHTARVEARMTAKGSFVVTTRGVKKLRLLLAASMFDPADKVEVTLNGKVRRLGTRLRKKVLLAEFAERFDRTFLPIAEVILQP